MHSRDIQHRSADEREMSLSEASHPAYYKLIVLLALAFMSGSYPDRHARATHAIRRGSGCFHIPVNAWS